MTKRKREGLSRRGLLKAGLGGGVVLAWGAAQNRSSLIQPGDILVHADGPNADRPIAASSLALNNTALAYAQDPTSKTIRKEREGLVVVVRLEPTALDAATQRLAAGGLVAYSAICPHQGCTVRQLGTLGARAGKLVCTCHGSQWMPGQGAKVDTGPARRALAGLPIKVENNQIIATGGFNGPVGLE